MSRTTREAGLPTNIRVNTRRILRKEESTAAGPSQKGKRRRWSVCPKVVSWSTT